MSSSTFRRFVTASGFCGVLVSVCVRIAHADPAVPGEEHCVVNVRSDDRLNMRAEPNSRSEIVARKRYASAGSWFNRSASAAGAPSRMATASAGCIGTTSPWFRQPCTASPG